MLENNACSQGSEEIGKGLTDTETKDELVQLKQACFKLSEVALNLNEPSCTEDLFDQIAKYAEEVERLRKPVLRNISIEAAEILIENYFDFLGAQYEHIPWLAAKVNEIQSGWRKLLSNKSSEKNFDFDEDDIKRDLQKSKREIARALSKWNKADTELQKANAKLRDFQNQPLPSDYDITVQSNYLKLQRQCFDDVASASQKDFELKRHVIQAAFPNDDEFLLQEKPSQQTEQAEKVQDYTVKKQKSTSFNSSAFPYDFMYKIPPRCWL